MGKYVKKKDEMVYPNLESLNPIINDINEVATILNSDKKDKLKKYVSGGAAGLAGFGTGEFVSYELVKNLGYGGTSAAGITSGLKELGAHFGGGMGRGIIISALPGLFGYIITTATSSYANNRQLKQEKLNLYKAALEKLQATYDALKLETEEKAEKIEELKALNYSLRNAVINLQKDLGIDEQIPVHE